MNLTITNMLFLCLINIEFCDVLSYNISNNTHYNCLTVTLIKKKKLIIFIKSNQILYNNRLVLIVNCKLCLIIP